jgi:hypothetical protein
LCAISGNWGSNFMLARAARRGGRNIAPAQVIAVVSASVGSPSVKRQGFTKGLWNL